MTQIIDFAGVRADADIDYSGGRGRNPTFDANGLLRTTRLPGAADASNILPFSFIAAAGSNQDAQLIKGSSGLIYGFTLHNCSASLRFVKIYNKATSPTSADTPALRYPLAPTGGGVARQYDFGIPFTNGIGFRITTGVADNDTGTCVAGDVVVNFEYK